MAEGIDEAADLFRNEIAPGSERRARIDSGPLQRHVPTP